MRYLSILALAVCSFWAVTPANSQGITATDCETDSEGAVTALGANAKCYMPADKWEATFHLIALCKGFPDFENSLSNCVSNGISTTEVSVTRGSELSLDGLIPPPGRYDYSIAITNNSFRIEGQVKFSAALNAIGNTGSNNEGIGGEMYCTAPTINQRTSDIFSQSTPASFIAMHNPENAESYGNGYLSMTRCSPTAIADTSDTGSYVIDTITPDGSSFGSRKSDFSYDIDPDSPLNLILLQDDNAEATSSENATRLMLVEKKDTVVPVGATTANYQYNLSQALNVWNCPLEACAPNTLTTINMGLINLQVTYE